MKKLLSLLLITLLAFGMFAGCGQEQEPPHDHQWTEATYEAPSTCTVCNETQGEALTPDFVKFGITPQMEVGKTYEYNSVGYDKVTPIKGKSTLVSYELLDSAGKLDAIDGYICHAVTIHTVFDAATINSYGANINMSFVNYYNIDFMDDNSGTEEETGKLHSLILVNGKEADVYVDSKNQFVDNSDGSTTSILELYVQVPVGYDGMVCGVANPAAQIPEDGSIADVYTPEDYLLFRLTGVPEETSAE